MDIEGCRASLIELHEQISKETISHGVNRALTRLFRNGQEQTDPATHPRKVLIKVPIAQSRVVYS